MMPLARDAVPATLYRRTSSPGTDGDVVPSYTEACGLQVTVYPRSETESRMSEGIAHVSAVRIHACLASGTVPPAAGDIIDTGSVRYELTDVRASVGRLTATGTVSLEDIPLPSTDEVTAEDGD